MRIVTWNCSGALRKKLDAADSLQADILVIQECEDPDRSTKEYKAWAGHYLWVGENKNKGVGIFSRKGAKLTPLYWTGAFQPSSTSNLTFHLTDLKLFLPCLVNDDITLVGIWTKEGQFSTFSYIGQLWLYLQLVKNQLNGLKTIFCGDFNSNACWDKKDRWWNHSDVVQEFSKLKMGSAYHHFHKEDYGSELEHTYYHYRKLTKPYHIDYTFLSNEMLATSKTAIGSASQWLSISDHMPLITDFRV